MTGRRRLAGAVIVLVALVIAAGSTGALYFAKRVRDGSAERFDALLAELRARGEPVAVEDLIGPPLADGDDGGPLLREAWVWLDENAPPTEEWPVTWDLSAEEWVEMSAEERARRVEFMQSLEPFLQIVHAAVERRALRVFVDPKLSADVRAGDPIPRVQTTMRILSARAITADDSHTRLRAQRSLGLLAGRLETIDGAISALVGLATEMGMLRRLREHVELDLVPAAAAAETLGPVLESPCRTQVLAGLRADRAQTITVLRMMVGDVDGAGFYTGPTVGGWMGALSRSSMADFALGPQDILDADPDRWSDLVRELADLYERTSPRWWRKDVATGVAGACAVIMCRLTAEGARTSALQSLARLSLASVAEFDRTGAWPASLDAIQVPDEVRIDPFTDAPFVFERLPDGVRISSPGPTDASPWRKRIVERNVPAEDGLIWTLRR